ncbi:nephrocystin-1 isoform X2 [Syngnathoides biaculeatus]|uniref:nephrocystin-1 isoform X2 n=1 Tax=Syngnathoides biaculeatus TaxID=300417 RepID=UPI002ADDF136|nr:nephrocystin-1 isoform X2 [Syngnathoides biaculeatus]
MPPKGRGPLQQVHREVDDMRGQLESLLKDVQGDDTESKEESFRRCQELQLSAEKTLKNLTQLTKADEIAPVGNYDQRKLEEERRLRSVLEQLNKLSAELSPPGPSTDPPTGDARKEGEGGTGDSDEADTDEDAAQKDDGRKDESRAANATPQSEPCVYTALSDFQGDQEGDLTVKRGDTLKIIRKTSDGWWLAENADGDRGVVPRTYLKIGSALAADKDEEEDEESPDEAEEEEEGSEELAEEEEEEEDEEEEKPSDAAQSNWSTFRKALTEIDATDVLAAMGAIPSGFRPSTLSKLLVDEGAKYKGSHFMQPELSQSQLSFSDLFLDPDTGRVRPRHTRTCVCFTLWSCKSIPTPGVGVQVLSRHIRLCAFDGTRVLSNIHTVRATYTPKNPRTWLFSPRTAGVLPSLLDGDCFLRCDADDPDLGILFELGVTFIRNSTGERGDLSCGWAFLKLSDAAGNALPSRTYELPVSGGTPYEKDVDMEGFLTRASSAGIFQQMLKARRQPKLIVKFKTANARIKMQLSFLPSTLLHCLNLVPLLAMYRQLLADALLVDRPTMQNADLIFSPVLATFPTLVDQPDLLDAVRTAWMDAESNMSRAQKRDEAQVKQEFAKAFRSSASLLLHSPSLPWHRWADAASEEQRSRLIGSALEALKRARGPSGGLEVLADPARAHLAFDVAEMTFDLLRVAR